ncbi:MAG: phosphotransferase [Dehalococcoidia bacterium]|nr:phosphotransferase [Dehalococcoidia bacterium]
MPDTLPTTPEEITAGWVGSRLGAPVSHLGREPITDRSGLNGETVRLHLTYEAPHTAVHPARPASVIAKLPGARSRGVAEYQRWYEREVRFYRELAPHTPMRTPRCFSAEIAANDDYVLLLEDLGALRQGDQVRGCSLAEARAALDAVAALHARWWESEPQAHPWLPSTTVGLERAGPVQSAFARAWEHVRDRFPAVAQGVLDRGVEAYPDLLAEVATGPVTVCHGDYRLDNVFFDDSPDLTAPHLEVVAFDWQFACRARGVYDVAYFLALDLEQGLLAAQRESLLAGYLDALASRGVTGAGAAALRRDYAISLILATAVFAIGAAEPHPSEASRLTHEAGLRRLGAEIEAVSRLGWFESR